MKKSTRMPLVRTLTSLLFIFLMTAEVQLLAAQKSAPKPGTVYSTLPDGTKLVFIPRGSPTLPYTPAELEGWYATYNHEYWSGKLPKARIVWGQLKKYGFTERLDDGTFLIHMDIIRNLQPEEARTTLLHEMAHVKVWGEQCHIEGVEGSCVRWTAEIHRIMLEGAFDDLI